MYQNWPNEQVRKGVGVIYFIIVYLLPLLILTGCYGGIAWVVAKKINTDIIDDVSKVDPKSGEKQTDIQTTKRNKTFQRALKNTIKTLVMVGVGFMVCWTTNQIIYLLTYFGYEIEWNGAFYHFTVFMVFLNCTINPFLYLLKYPDFQKAVKETYVCSKEENYSEQKTRQETVSSDVQ